eukprot:TRINITY_DN8853_c0_g1_i2.p1 TRINITY_DN8853_c0_g1~~TRINITY_DN8853_c0_g1_i2.p1  ORF type:complete len:254 (+),score=56.36 TRINITY_DN8853_c0_g1_i2:76-837(+)
MCIRDRVSTQSTGADCHPAMLGVLRRRACSGTGIVRHLCSSSDPLAAITHATASLSSFSARLQAMSHTAQSPNFKHTILHCRDAELSEFHSAESVSARASLLPVAEGLEKEMHGMATDFVETVAPSMATAMKLCQDAPCGGVSWVLAEHSTTPPEQDGIQGMETPCGKLHLASVDFVKLAHSTRTEAELACRAACFLRMATEHNAPLAVVRTRKEGQRAMAKRFSSEKVPTPWLRTQEEYDTMIEALGGSAEG